MRRLPGLLMLLSLAGLTACTDGVRAEDPALEPVPEARLIEVPDTVRHAIEQALEEIERLRRTQAESAELAAAYGHLGDVLFVHEFAAQARVAYGNAASLAPGDVDWHYLLGFLEYNEGNLHRALDHFGRVLEINGRHQLARIRRGRVYLDLGQLDAAETDFTNALKANPDSAAALAGLGRAALDRRAYREAVEYLQRALERNPSASRLYYPLGMAHRGLGQRDRARESLEKRGDGEELVDDPLLARVSAKSRSAQFYLETGLARADEGELESSRRLLATALQLEPDNPRVLLNYGEVLARLERFDEAHSIFSRLVEVDPASAEHFFYLGQIEEVRGSPHAAVEAYSRALALDDAHDRAREALGFIRMEQRDYEAAAAQFATLAERSGDPGERVRMLYWQGIASLGAGDCERAARVLDEAREASGDFVIPVMNALVRLRATCARPGGKALEEVLAWAESLYDTDPGLASAETLAMVQAALGRFGHAVDFQAQAMFEALKRGELEQRIDLQANMARYRAGKPAVRPYAPDDPVFTVGLR